MFDFFKSLKAFAFPRRKFHRNSLFKKLNLLGLEERITPANFVVSSRFSTGAGSLREAITLANTTAGDDQISFNFSSGSSPYTITLNSALPTIVSASTPITGGGTAGTVTINGLGASSLIISGDNGNSGRDFNIFNINPGGNLSISGVTVSGAQTSGNGGAFSNIGGKLTVSNSTISGNSVNGFGGGINNNGGTLTVTNSTISGNASNFGGGINSYGGTVMVTNSTISGNSSFIGGGICNANSGTLTVTNSTISGNSAANAGGGIDNSGSGTLTVTNSTISGNSAANAGGGISNNGGTLNIANTILANSTSGGDYAGTGSVGTNTNNLVEDGSLPGTGEITGDPFLGPLQNNGGPTFTMALLNGSPAIGAGNATISNATPVNGLDQRGFSRTTSDIGAYAVSNLIKVTTTADTVDPTDGVTSLREAITLANTTAGDDQISFNFSTGSSPYTITLNSALPNIIDASTVVGTGTAGTVTINGLGASSLIISGDNGDTNRNFNLFNINSGGNLSISGVTVSGAKTSGNGAAFNNSGTLTVANSNISGNSANFGGGIYNQSTLTVSNSTLSGNSATSDGGGIFNDGTLTVTNSTLSSNSATSDGGGIFNHSFSTITVTNSTLSGNSANTSGGGIFNHSFSTITVTNSTLSGNSANFGGGIYNQGTLTVTNSTLSGNSANTSGGGGIFNNATLNIANTIIANNTSGGDYAGTGTIGTNISNLVEDGSLPGAMAADPLLGPLQNNGGPTFTMALLAGSPAIGAGNATISNASPVNGLDQRGFTRITSDIGAYAVSNLITVTSTADTVDPTDGVTSLREAITLANTTAGDDQISFNLTGASPYTITLNSALPNIIDASTVVSTGTAGTLTINGLGSSSLIISGNNGNSNRNFNIFKIDTGGNLTISGVKINGANRNGGSGGSIYNQGTLTVNNSMISDNSVTAGGGGGIYNQGTLTVNNSTISNNSVTAGGGGGIYNRGTLNLNNTTISNNSVTGGSGGGINNHSNSTANITNSTISNNVSAGGGGIFFNTNSIGNITNSTISGNSANVGGGIFNNATLNIANTIIANSTSGGDFYGAAPTINTNNLVEDGNISGTTYSWAVTGDPLLGPLQNNGGPTFTMALLTGSAAIGAGNATISNASPVNGLDQRGINRTTSDIGAYSFGIQVTTTADTVDPTDGVTSLREAITLANNTAGDDQISFNFSNGNSPYTITLNSALPNIIDAVGTGTPGTVTINGLGASSLIISGNNGDTNRNFRIFNISSGGNLFITGVTVSGANYSGTGGGFYNEGNLTINSSNISGNSAANAGGGIYSYFLGTLTVNNSTISGNFANRGGGIFGNGVVHVNNSTIFGNSANNNGGGIHNSSGTLIVTNSTISGNSANNNGGGIHLDGSSTLTVTNSTISGNSANNNGGGIFNSSTLNNVTINIANTIIANSTSGGDYAGGGSVGTNTNNLVEDGSLPGAIAADPLLGPLQNNGGPTFTMALLAGSPAIYAGNAPISNAPPVNGLDQRGVIRSSTFPSIGAYEAISSSATLLASPNPSLFGQSVTFTAMVSAVSPGTGTPTGTVVFYDGATALGTRTLTAGSASLSTSSLSVGNSHSITVVYNGDTNYTGSTSSTTTQTVNLAPTITSANSTSFIQGLSTNSFQVTASGFPTSFNYSITAGSLPGGVTLNSNTGLLSGAPVGGSVGTYPVTISVSNGVNPNGSQQFTLKVNPAPVPLITGSAPTNNNPNNAGSAVSLYDPNTNQPSGVAVPFPGFTGQIRVAAGDFNIDGRSEIVAAAGPGGGPAVTILDSQTGEPRAAFFAYDPAFTGGVFVAVKDFNNDGVADIITGAGFGGGPHVKVFNGANLQLMRSFFAYDQSFTGGVTVAATDLNGDNILDLVTGAGPGGGPLVKVFDGATNEVISQWFAYSMNFTGGVFVGAGDISNDGNIEVVTGAGIGGGPVVGVWNPNTAQLISQFFAYDPAFTGGVRVGVSDATGDGINDLVTGAGPGGGPQVNAYNFPNLDLLFSFFSGDPTNTGGVFVS